LASVWSVACALVLLLPSAAPRPNANPSRLVVPESRVGSREIASVLTFCWEQFEGLTHESAIALKHQLNFRSPTANDRFIDEAVLRPAPADALFLHIDNTMIKSLNDHVFRDKALSAATEALWTRIFFETMQADLDAGRTGAEMPWVAYSDYKTIRIGFRKTSPELERWLREVYQRASRRFSSELGSFEYVDGLIRRKGGLVAEPYNWHVGGLGKDPAHAAAAARAGRFEPTTPGATRKLQDAREPKLQGLLAELLESLEALREKIQDDATAMFGGQLPPILEVVPGTRLAVLSKDAIEILKRVDDHEGERFYKNATSAFQNRFDGEFPSATDVAWANFLENLRAYYRAVDLFMPPIYERQEVLDLGYGQARHGIVSYDLVGANKDNVATFMSGMAQTADVIRQYRREGRVLDNGAIVAMAVHRAQTGQAEASRRFEERRNRFALAVERLGVPGKVIFSGDEALFYPERPLTASERERLAGFLAELGPPDSGRLGFLPPTYEGRADAIPAARRAAFLSFGEAVEKKLRLELEAGRLIPHARLRQIGFAVDLEANDLRAGRVGLILTGKVTPEDKAVIEAKVRAILPGGFTYASTRVVRSPSAQ
jgi:hypothetical protein